MSYSLPWELEGHFFPFCGRGSSNSSSCASFPFQWCCADWGACSLSFIRLKPSSPVKWTGPNYRLQHWHTLSPATGRWLIHVVLKLCKLALYSLALCQIMTECSGDRLRKEWFLVGVLGGRKGWVLEYRYPFCSTISIMALIFQCKYYLRQFYSPVLDWGYEWYIPTLLILCLKRERWTTLYQSYSWKWCNPIVSRDWLSI